MTIPTDNWVPRAGYTLPVFACAAAIAALRWLQHKPSALTSVAVDLIEPAQTVAIPVEQVAGLSAKSALAVTRSDPGDNLDLTRNTPVWAVVTWADVSQKEPITLIGGEGIGRQMTMGGQAAIYAYAQRLLQENLTAALQSDAKIQVTLILPEGRSLAQRTSNAAFGVMEGLSLLGTTGIAQPLSAPGQLEIYRQELRQKAVDQQALVFCLGENGLDLATQLGIPPAGQIKTANWLGPLLAEAGLQAVQSILLFGYHGKLIKLAAGIFHTHHHLADGRREVLVTYGALAGLPAADLQVLFSSQTAEAALQHLRRLGVESKCDWVAAIYGAIAQTIDQRAQAYIQTHSERSVTVGSVLFDRDRQIIIASQNGQRLLDQLCHTG
ncbi:MAG: cobalt-precorrin-5B (C(1))-methyltransferase [Cyanothece sp. SIO1E1]|nr:cobalt-precorrin-5B (C(1))-methyltransferase [Cyanothece sp. SIO1E1]